MKMSKFSEPAGRPSETLSQVWDGQHFLAYFSGEEIVIQHLAFCLRISKIDSEKMGTGDILLSLAVALNSFEWLFALRLAFLPIQRLILEELGMGGATLVNATTYMFACCSLGIQFPQTQCLSAPPGAAYAPSKRRKVEKGDISPMLLRLE